jgi:hypothetical protein
MPSKEKHSGEEQEEVSKNISAQKGFPGSLGFKHTKKTTSCASTSQLNQTGKSEIKNCSSSSSNCALFKMQLNFVQELNLNFIFLKRLQRNSTKKCFY